jgi:apolipoprotein D and lipocalin family protein
MNPRASRTVGLRVLAVCITLGLSNGCTGVPDGVSVVTDFDIERYLGTWYEIARLDHSFERGLSQVTATYSLREDGGVHVVNRGRSDDTGEWDEAIGKAYFVGARDIGQLKVSFFGPFYGGYNVIDLDKIDYQYSLVAGPNRDYLWILARTPQLESSTVETLIDRARALGFATDELIFVDHN